MTTSTDTQSLSTVIAHRGASGDAPENTLAALALAAEQGADCVEIDVSISRDGVAFVHHDDHLQRCTDGEGLLCEKLAAELDQLDASKLMPRYSREPLPRLVTVIDLLIERNMGLNLEIKPRAGLEKPTVEAICKDLSNRWPSHLALVFSSFNHHSLALARDHAPHIDRALLFGQLPDDWRERMAEHAAVNVHIDGSRLTQAQAASIKQSGYGLFAYTVNDTSLATALLQWGVDGIFTDYPAKMLTTLQH